MQKEAWKRGIREKEVETVLKEIILENLANLIENSHEAQETPCKADSKRFTSTPTIIK